MGINNIRSENFLALENISNEQSRNINNLSELFSDTRIFVI